MTAPYILRLGSRIQDIINSMGTYPKVLKNMLDDIKTQCSSIDTIIIVVSGDIIDKARYDNEMENIIISFFEKLKTILKGKKVYIDIVPGNHDKSQSNMDELIVDKYINNEQYIEIQKEEWNYNLIAYKNYLRILNNIIKIFDNKHKNIDNTYYVETIKIKDVKIFFINIDTAWCSKGKGGDADKGKLRIVKNHLLDMKNEYQKSVADSESDKIFTFCVAHHPLNWLKSCDETLLSQWFLDRDFFNIDAFLCGHTHDRQVSNICNNLNSYITLVTGIGWNKEDVEKEKEKHRYSIYTFNLENNVCEIIIRKTNSDLTFEYDYDILLTEEEKNRQKILLPISTSKLYPYYNIPVYIQDKIQFEYCFINSEVINKILKLSHVIFDMGLHMQNYLEMYIRDFFVKYELNKKSKATLEKFEIYEEYFYKGIQNKKAESLFDKINNKKILYDNFISYLQQFCEYFSLSLSRVFPEIGNIRCHFRRFFWTENNSVLYITFCQGSSIKKDGKEDPDIRDVDYTNSLIECAFLSKTALVFSHNINYNQLEVKKWNDFITIIPYSGENYIEYEKGNVLNEEKKAPLMTCAISIQEKNKSTILDVLNYMKIEKIVTQVIKNYLDIFHINMKSFIEYMEEQNNSLEEEK